MNQSLARFVHALRNADVEVSTAETLLAAEVWQHVGTANRRILKDSLEMALAKSRADKRRFDECFETFFRKRAFNDKPKPTLLRSFSHEEVSDLVDRSASPEVATLTRHVLGNRLDELLLAIDAVAAQAGIHTMTALRDKPRVAGRIIDLLQISQLDPVLSGAQGDAATGVAYVRRYLSDQVREYVERHYQLEIDYSGKRAVLHAALNNSLEEIPVEYASAVRQEVLRVAEQLRYRHRRRQKRNANGALDVRASLRRNMAYDGALYQLRWRKRHRKEGTLFVLCDVSGSMARLSRFFLLLLYHLTDILPEVRSFAFSSNLGEITGSLTGESAEVGIETALFEWGNGNTDYGSAFSRFRTRADYHLDSRSTVVILGDARSNFYPPRTEVLREIANRSRRVIWLNPEPDDQWGEGDSVMRLYQPYTTAVHRLRNLQDLKRVADELTRLR